MLIVAAMQMCVNGQAVQTDVFLGVGITAVALGCGKPIHYCTFGTLVVLPGIVGHFCGETLLSAFFLL